MQDFFTSFQGRLSASGGECYLVAHLAEAAQVIATHPALTEKEVVVPPDFSIRSPWSAIVPMLRDQGIRIREAGTPASVADAPAGLSGGELAVAETGSVLIAENALEARVVGMLTLAHFVLVRASDLVPMLDAVGTRLLQLTQAGSGQHHYVSLITGPSRTADIERTLTIGVQGPKTLCVIIVQD
jgi:L-lactate dehydrogenase complex protein LldG